MRTLVLAASLFLVGCGSGADDGDVPCSSRVECAGDEYCNEHISVCDKAVGPGLPCSPGKCWRDWKCDKIARVCVGMS